ncbi:MAG: GAF domain-containing protein [Pyrinomonadaceae bacterium]
MAIRHEQDEITSTEMKGLFEYLREATEQLEVVNRVVAAVNSSRTIEDMFGLASEQIRAIVPFDRASIALCDDDGLHLRVFAISGKKSDSLEVGAVAALQGSVTEYALKQREIVLIPEVKAEKRFNIYADLEREGFHAAVCMPLFSGDVPIGSMNLTSCTSEAYGRKHLVALERLGPPLAIAIQKVLLLEQAEQRSQAMEAAVHREELAGRIGRQLSSSLDPNLVLQETVDTLGEALNADRCHVTLFDEQDENAFVGYEYVSGNQITSLRGRRLRLRESKFAQQVFAASEPIAINDIRGLPPDELLGLYAQLDVCAVMAAPVVGGGEVSGLLELHVNCEPRSWTDDDKKVLAAIAAQVSVALTNARLYEASRRRAKELEGLYEISRAFSTMVDTSEIYGRLARAIAELVGGEMCLLATYHRRDKMVRAEAPGYQTTPQMVRDFRFALSPGGTGLFNYRNGESEYVYRTGESFVSNDPAKDERFNQQFMADHDVRSTLIVPMLIKRELIGFIYVANRPGGFRHRDTQLLEIFAAQVAETIANARLFATIQAQAEREAVVNRLLLVLQQANDLKQGVEVVVERLAQMLELDRCVAVLYDDPRDEGNLRHGVCGPGVKIYGEWCAPGLNRLSDDVEVEERTPIADWICEHRRPLVINDVLTHPLATGVEDLIERTGLRSIAVVPIIHHGRIVGSLSAHQTRRRRHWVADDVDLLTAVATQIGATLENARLIAELREANRLKDDFLATLSHELRTPLTAIKGWIELLAENEAIMSEPESAGGVAVIQNATLSLTQLISDLLDLSRLQRRVFRLDIKPADINLSVLNAVQAVQQTADANRVGIELSLASDLPLIDYDPQRIQQVLWNLLTNAIKFTPAGGRIKVRSKLLSGVAPGDAEIGPAQWVVVEVEDTGEGISPEFLPYVWDRFRQAESSSRRHHGGLGIGLALVKELVEAHQGLAEAKSDGHGATFTVRLPVGVAKAEAEKKEAAGS